MSSDPQLNALRALGRSVRRRILRGRREPREWSAVAGTAASDQQYEIDRFSEEGLLDAVASHCAPLLPLRVLSEGLDPAGVTVGTGTPRQLLIIDPVDGTRGLMHDKRSAWFLAALAPLPDARLRTITHAVMVELPHARSQLSDVFAVGPEGPVSATTDDVGADTSRAITVRPSQTTDLRHGFATVVRFFSGASELLGRVHDQLLAGLHPDDLLARQDAFEDQYISSGGQMHGLITGRDRFVADLRPLAARALGITVRSAHPYDLLALPIAERCGVIITNAAGAPLDAPLDVTTPVAWVGWANAALRSRVEPALQSALRTCGLQAP